MGFELPPLPYLKDALEPHVSTITLDHHYERHHRGYLEKLRALIEGRPEADLTLEDLILRGTGPVYDNAAQVWNHTFYWRSMTPEGGGRPSGRLRDAIDRTFGSHDAFREEFVDRAAKLFGSGYVWLTLDPECGRLAIEPLANAGNPLLMDRVPLLTMDVWEHAYYLDHQSLRARYAEAFIDHLANWSFARDNYDKAA